MQVRARSQEIRFVKLTFLGAAGEVTGSSYRVDTPEVRFLVDCGMFQGGTEAEKKNRDALAFDPKRIDFVLLTHAHIDHSGLIPRLAAFGYTGPVFCTRATADLASVMLPDSGHVQEQDAQWANRMRHDEHKRGGTVIPLYTVLQAQRSLRLLHGVEYDQPLAPHPAVSVVFRDAGHIVGSSILEIEVGREGGERRKLVFSGDLGLPASPLVRDPTPVRQADVLVVESTYGTRVHRSLLDTEDELAAVVTDTLSRRHGNVVLPAFAVGRTQAILCVLAKLVQQQRVPPLEVFVDSPMATAATEVTRRHRDILDEEARRLLAWIESDPREFRVRFVLEPEESKALNAIESGAVILSASGMCEGGRIRHHLRYNLPRPGAAVVITGFQASGTLGRRLVDGARHVRIFGEEVPVRASIHTIGGLSAHADQQGVLGWLRHFASPPGQTFVVHGEREVSLEFASLVRQSLGWHDVVVPARGDQYSI
jgi:metallo-beta-lactamase family protein